MQALTGHSACRGNFVLYPMGQSLHIVTSCGAYLPGWQGEHVFSEVVGFVVSEFPGKHVD